MRVLFFAQASDVFGASELDLNLSDDAIVETLLARLAERSHEGRSLLQHSAVAINEEYANRSGPLHEGDTVAIIPPVSGG